ncbi:MAG TPA: bile acid:sodium symporter family protein [Acetobacteraceae bacterium]|jgi:sodium/bile acid cotransporter 7
MTMTERTLRIIAARVGDLRQFRPDGFVLALAGVVVVATILPCDGEGARVFGALAKIAIALLFFLQGARLSREAIINGLTHWRIHCVTSSVTFAVFPAIGLMISMLFPALLPPTLWMGVLFACALPSTVQSSIALTSIADGNVAAAVCSATMSSLVGIVLSPLLFSMMSRLHGGGIDTHGIWQIILQLLVPFVAGHLLRPWIGAWAARNRSILAVTDRSSILLVVYTAFSAAVVHGIWHQVPATTLLTLGFVMALLLASGLLVAVMGGRAMALRKADEVAVVFCGSQKSLVVGVPMASALLGGAAAGTLLLPIMIYHPMQLVVGTWLSRRYAAASTVTPHAAITAPPVAIKQATTPVPV